MNAVALDVGQNVGRDKCRNLSNKDTFMAGATQQLLS